MAGILGVKRRTLDLKRPSAPKQAKERKKNGTFHRLIPYLRDDKSRDETPTQGEEQNPEKKKRLLDIKA